MRKWSLVVVVGVLSVLRGAGAQTPGFTVVAESGEQAAVQEPGVTYSSPGQPCIGDDAQVMFVTDLFGGAVPNFTSAIYAGQPGTAQPVASEGQVAPGTGGGTWASLLGVFRIARGSGQMAFDGTITGADAAHDGGIWAGPAGSFALVRREGDPAPGLSGPVFADMAGITRVDPALNDAGAVAFRAFLAGSGVTEDNDEALFAGAPGAIGPVFREGDAAPGAGGDTFVDSGAPVVDSKDTFGPPSLNGGGKLLFISHLAGAGVSGLNAQGIWHGLPNAVSLAARAGEAAPGLPVGQLFRTFEIAVLNDADQIAVVSLTASALDLNHITGVWLGAPGSLAKLAAQGEAAPSDPDGAAFGGVYDQLRLNGAGQVAFLAALSNAEFGIYGYDPVQGLRLLARSGTPAPGIAGQQFTPGSNDFSLFLNQQGKVLFRGTTSPSTLVGLWIADVATGQVDLLAHTGAPAEIDGTTRTLASISLAVGAADHHEGGGQDGRASAFADDGNVTFSALLDGTQAAVIRTGSGGGGGGGCTDLASCRAALGAALPDPATATDKKGHRVAELLEQLFSKIGKLLDKAATFNGKKQAKKHSAARSKIDKLVAKATAADGKGRLAVPLESITAPANALRSYVP